MPRRALFKRPTPTPEELTAFRWARNHKLRVEVDEHRGRRIWTVLDQVTGWELLIYRPDEQAVRVGKTKVEVTSWQEALALAVKLRDQKPKEE